MFFNYILIKIKNKRMKKKFIKRETFGSVAQIKKPEKVDVVKKEEVNSKIESDKKGVDKKE